MNPDSELAEKPPYKPPGMFWLLGAETFVASAAQVVFPAALLVVPLAAPPGTTRVLKPVAKPSVKMRFAVSCLLWELHCWNPPEIGFTAAFIGLPTTPMLRAVPATGRVWF